MKIIFKIIVAVVVLWAAVYGSRFIAGMTAALGAGVSLERWRGRVVRAGGAIYCGVWISWGAVPGYEAEEVRDQVGEGPKNSPAPALRSVWVATALCQPSPSI